jgi:ketosteroid isomerase-like protein
MKKLFIFLVLLSFFACNQAGTEIKNEKNPIDLDAVKTQIIAADKQFEDAFAKGDSLAMLNVYHPQAKVFPPNAEPGDGKIMASFAANASKMGVKSVKLNSDEVSGGPEEVVETGTYELSDGTKAIDNGKYIVIWKKDGDKWKIYRDIWNSNIPVPSTATPKP